jgi:tRNA modification GTPase
LDTIAAITTAKGTAAISSIQIAGPTAADIIHKIFKPIGAKQFKLTPGSVLTGTIADDKAAIDHVVLGCLDTHCFEINCHGNPLIVEKIARLLADNGAKLLSAEDFLLAQLQDDPSKNSIDIEAAIAQTCAATLAGTKIIAAQPSKGLGKLAEDWLNDFDNIPLNDLKAECTKILTASKPARLLTGRVKVIIAGAPNSGKSTLLNAIAGKQKAIVSPVAGTTRDWVSTTIDTGRLLIEFFDSAGLDAALTAQSAADAESQNLALDLITQADLILEVIDSTAQDITGRSFQTDKPVLRVFNKSDITQASVDPNIPAEMSVFISAKNADNIDTLIEKIHDLLGIADFDPAGPICFTQRQRSLLQELTKAASKPAAKTIISQLLNSAVSV